MIPVQQEPEPARFAAAVRNPGIAFLRRVPHPTRDEFKKKAFWKEALPMLKMAYGDILCIHGELDTE